MQKKDDRFFDNIIPVFHEIENMENCVQINKNARLVMKSWTVTQKSQNKISCVIVAMTSR